MRIFRQIKAIQDGSKPAVPAADEPRIFELHKSIYQMRVTRLQNAAQAKRVAERMKSPGLFPVVPAGDPSKPT